jgi:ABC-type histidine transport system ATPase subunit
MGYARRWSLCINMLECPKVGMMRLNVEGISIEGLDCKGLQLACAPRF